MALALIIIALLVLCIKKVLPRCCSCFQSLVNKILSKLMFNSVLRSLMQTYLLTCISTLTSLLNVNLTHTQGKVDFAIAICIIIFAISFPIFTVKFLRRNKDKLSEPAFKSKYDSIYQNVDYYKDEALSHTSFFLTRRLLFAFVIVFCGKSLVLQVFLADILSTLILIYFITVKPMINW